MTDSIDWIIAAPVLPLLPLIATWWLPWERWIPWKKIPKAFGGPYLFYASFVAWHFKAASWVVMAIAVGGLLVCVAAVSERTGRRRNDAP